MPEEDGAAVAIEQDHRVVDEPGQDLVEVEPAADVARDAAKGVGAMEVVGDLVGGSAGADDRADGQGDGTEEVGVDARRDRRLRRSAITSTPQAESSTGIADRNLGQPAADYAAGLVGDDG